MSVNTDDAIKLDATELRGELLAEGQKLSALRGRDRNDENVRNDIQNTMRSIQILDGILTATERAEEQGYRGFSMHPDQRGPQVGTSDFKGPDTRSAGEFFTQTEEYRAFQGRGGQGIGQAEVRTLLTQGDGTAGAGLFSPRLQPLAPRSIRQRLFVRDLLSVTPTDIGTSVPYIRETNNATDDALVTVVAEGGAKPEVAMEFVEADAPIRKIAGWIPATTEILNDAKTVRAYIDNRLAYMVRLAEEKELLSGSGTAPHLRGILNTTGVQAQAFSVDPISTIGLSNAKIEGVGGEADGVAMNPADYWAMVTTRNADQFDGGFSTGSPFNAPSPTVWGVPVVRSPGVTVGTAISGSWSQGATIFDRESVTIRVGDQHADYFTNNKVAILAEERIGLAVFRPDFFVVCDLTA